MQPTKFLKLILRKKPFIIYSRGGGVSNYVRLLGKYHHKINLIMVESLLFNEDVVPLL
jgi:hypothetical protein